MTAADLQKDAAMFRIFIGWDSRFPEPADVLRTACSSTRRFRWTFAISS